jgi:aminoglycoside 3-N-acetyltransferase
VAGCSRRRAPGLVTRERIAADLAELGVAAGDTVMLHAAVGAIGWIVGGPDRVLGAVLDVVGETGTLLMYVGWDGSPYDVTIGVPKLPPALAEAWPAYDPETSRAVRDWGVLAEYLRTWPGARRSAHPDSSFAAVGAKADELTRDHPLQYGMGPGSPLAKLCEAEGKVVLLGSPLSNVTLLHHAEHLAEVLNKGIVRYWAPILRDGEKTWVEIEEFNTGGQGTLPWFGPTDMFEAIVRGYLQEGRGRVGHVGAAQSYLLDAAGLTEYAVGWIEERFSDYEPQDYEVEMRPAAEPDHRELVALLGMYDEELLGSTLSAPRQSTRVDEFLEDPDRKTFVASADGNVVGVIVVSQAAPGRGSIDLAFVEPEFRRRGILRELEIEATGFLREAGCCSVEIHVRPENHVAREAWRALGYTPYKEYMERPL